MNHHMNSPIATAASILHMGNIRIASLGIREILRAGTHCLQPDEYEVHSSEWIWVKGTGTYPGIERDSRSDRVTWKISGAQQQTLNFGARDKGLYKYFHRTEKVLRNGETEMGQIKESHFPKDQIWKVRDPTFRGFLPPLLSYFLNAGAVLLRFIGAVHCVTLPHHQGEWQEKEIWLVHSKRLIPEVPALYDTFSARELYDVSL